MRAYIIRRLLLTVPTLFILTVLVFLSVRFLPGDVIDTMVSESSVYGECVQQRLARSAGEQTRRGKSQSPVAWMAGRRETDELKPIDTATVKGWSASYRAVTRVNAQVASRTH